MFNVDKHHHVNKVDLSIILIEFSGKPISDLIPCFPKHLKVGDTIKSPSLTIYAQQDLILYSSVHCKFLMRRKGQFFLFEHQNAV